MIVTGEPAKEARAGSGRSVPQSPIIVRDLTVAVSGLPAALTGLRIAHVTDLHFRRWGRVARASQELLQTLEFDLIVATGDFGTSRRR